MPWQLIYTSAPRGLSSGQTGFCTVARSRDLREALAQRLEQLSYYHYLRVAEAATPGRNPTVCAFRNIDLRGTKYQVLTRIQPCGLDFTARTNHLAHHLVFQSEELGKLPSPAAIFRFWNGWMTSWQGDPRFLDDPAVEVFSAAAQTCLPAQTWLQVTGDAGRAAGLLEGECVRGCYLICPPDSEQQLVAMYSETLQLLNLKGEYPLRSWRHTFTTFLQSDDNPADFQWRACQEGTPAHQQAAQRAAMMIPLRSVRVPANSLVKPAREGLKPPAPPSEPGPTEAIVALRKRDAQGREHPHDPAMDAEYWKKPEDPWQEPAKAKKQPIRISPTTARIAAVVVVVLVLLVIKLLHGHRPPAERPAPQPTVTKTSPEKAEPKAVPSVAQDPAQLDRLLGEAPTYIFTTENVASFNLPVDQILRLANFLHRFDHLETRPADIQLAISTDTWDSAAGVPMSVDSRQTQSLAAHAAGGLEVGIDYAGWINDNHSPLAFHASFQNSPAAFALRFAFSKPDAGEAFRLLIVNQSNGPAPLRVGIGLLEDAGALRRSLSGVHLLQGDWQMRPFVAAPNARQPHYLYDGWPADELPAPGSELDFAAVKKNLASALQPLSARASDTAKKLGEQTRNANLDYPLGEDLSLTNRKLASIDSFSPAPSTTDFVEYMNRLKKAAKKKSWPLLYADDDDAVLASKFQQLHDLWPKPIAGFTNYFSATWQNLKELEKIRQEKSREQDYIDKIQARLNTVPGTPRQSAYVGLFIVDPPRTALEMIRFENQ